jgi:hypothetical protein
MNYRLHPLNVYIKNSELRDVNNRLRVRLSPELAKKYDAGIYETGLKNFTRYIAEIDSLELKYPGRAEPIYYVYIVPDEDFHELLDYPYPQRTGGGRPVHSLDLDSFSAAYGTSQNVLASADVNPNIMRQENLIHEFAHLSIETFFDKDSWVDEGFAEIFPLWALGYEEKFSEHSAAVRNLRPNYGCARI